MVHHTQKARLRNLEIIGKWITSIPPGSGEIDKDSLARKIMLVLGASRQKADEYIELVLGE